MVALVTREAALFVAGAVSGAAAKTIPELRAVQEGVNKGMGFIEAFTLNGKEEGLKGYWKVNLPQVTYPLDVLRLRLTVEPGHKTMAGGWKKMLPEEN